MLRDPQQFRFPARSSLILITSLTVWFPVCSTRAVACAPDQQWASPDTTLAGLCASGFQHLEQGDFLEAYRHFRRALRVDANNPPALFGIGRVMLEVPAGGLRAVEYLRRALVLEPGNQDYRYYKALAHIRLSKTDVGRDNSIIALQEIERLLQLNPSHPDAYYQRGVLLRDNYEEPRRAIEQFRLQLAVTPSHPSARVALLKSLMVTGGWDTAIAAAESTLARSPAISEVYPFLAAAHWKEGRFLECMEVFQEYFNRVNPEERVLYQDLSLILPPDEQAVWASLDDEGRQNHWEHYWQKRDPHSGSGVNDRLLEHYIRIAYARIEYGEKVWPWDARGAMFVRYGEPDITTGLGRPFALDLVRADWESMNPEREVPVGDWDFHIKQRELYRKLGLPPIPLDDPASYSQSDQANKARREGQFDIGHFVPITDSVSRLPDASGELMSTGSATPEEWFYTNLGLDIRFEDPVHSGRYLLANRWVLEAMESHIPSVSAMEISALTFDPMELVATFKGEGGKTEIDYYVGLLPEDFDQFQSDRSWFSYLDAELELFTRDWRRVDEAGSRITNLPTTPQITVLGSPVFVHGMRTNAHPGDYLLSTILIDPNSGQRARVDEEISLPDYSGSELMISDILLAARITEVPLGREGLFIRRDLEVLPLPGRIVEHSKPFSIYFEVYNLTKDNVGATDYEIEYSVAEAPEGLSWPKALLQGIRRLVGQQGGRAVLSSTVLESGISRDAATHLEIDVSRLPPGDYVLGIQVADRLTGSQTQPKSVLFRLMRSRAPMR